MLHGLNYNLAQRLRVRSVALCLALFAWCGGALADAADTAFLAAREAFRVGDAARLNRQIPTLQGHPLQLQVEYWQLRMRLDGRDATGVPEFLSRNAGTYLADKLRGDWLRTLGNRGDWESFQRELPPLVQADNEITCYSAQASKSYDAVRTLWLSGQELPKACDGALEQMVTAQLLKVEDVWQRVRRLLEGKKPNAARSAAAYLPADEGFDGRAIDTAAKSPGRYLDRLPANFGKTRGSRELALLAIQRLARSDVDEAAKRLTRLEDKHGNSLTAEERAYAWGQVAWLGAQGHRPEALAWYGKASATQLSDDAQAWRARAALRAQDWLAVQMAIAQMPHYQRVQPDWIYWQARALAAQKNRNEARHLYEKIAGQPNFYGNLADEELGRTINVPPRAAPPTAEEMAAASANVGLQRAVALIQHDMRVEGIREWSWAIRGMNDRQLLAVANFAKQNEIWDRAIYTANQTQAQHDYSLRFIAPFLEYVAPKATALSLDNGWVYGLMRQESRFVTNAKSSAGAKGLMQVMPSTAKWVAKKIRLASYRPAHAAEMETNVTLGTHYLKMVLDSLDNHPVLASAAYNAGPGRARRWRAEAPLEGAIYAETIPFAETRDYVKKVMSNAVYYSALFESKPQSLKARLGVIRPRGNGERGVDELP